MGDVLASMNTRAVFTSVSASGNAVWLSGQSVQPYQVSPGGAIRLGANTAGQVFGSTAVATALERVVANPRGTHVFQADLAAVAQRSIDAEATLRNALKPASNAAFGTAPATGAYNANADPKLQYLNPLTGANAFNPVAQQLQVVARMVEAALSGATGARRQVFFVSIGGFDTRYRIAADYFSILQLFSAPYFNAAYIPRVLVQMRLGGASNRSLSNIVRKSREDLDALRRSGVGGIGALLWKNASKLGQFVAGPR
jgi:uncharacterized protein (DUF1501 family)